MRRLLCLIRRHSWLYTGRMRWGTSDTYHLRYRCARCDSFQFRRVQEAQ